ncbi:MAG: hypothetical protein HY000_22015 [Planctomycetes bacterium]|nr:hypothetical protein [Planctomycetota bacterium]
MGTNKKLRLKGDGTASDEFFRSDFEAQTVSGEHLRIYYSWNRGGRWEAPESPRIALGGAAGLLKLQASTVLPSGTPDDDPPLEFLRELTALLHKSPLSHAFRQGE